MHHYKIATDHKLVFVQMNGEYSVRDLVNIMAEVSRDTDYDPSFQSLVDLQNSATIIPALESQSVIEAATLIIGQAPAKSAVVSMGVEAEIVKVTDYGQIMSYNLLSTPGLVINEKLVAAGRIPKDAEVMTWIADAMN